MYYAHSENNRGHKEPVIDHLKAVAALSKKFASIWNGGNEGEITGLFHDIGKYTELFQKVLDRKEIHVDHATPGAAAVMYRYKAAAMAAALAIQGHHDGLQCGAPNKLGQSLLMKNEMSELGKVYSSRNYMALLDKLLDENPGIPDTIKSDFLKLCKSNKNISAMIYIRMLFSALTDADFLTTEAHFEGNECGMVFRHEGMVLCPDEAYDKLLSYKKTIEEKSNASQGMKQLRNDLFNDCINAATEPKGLFTLTAPTGAGKTLSMLGFALKHAGYNKMRRIIIVLPFLNIIEQTAKIYRDIFGNSGKYPLVLEDHSLVDIDEGEYIKLLSENWDAPIIITTTVKFFESIFSNRPSECRKLHNIANSVIIFDEAQTMPASLTIPTLSALASLCKGFGCSVVFSTATQPAFDTLNDFISKNSQLQWQPKEIVRNQHNLFERARRVNIIWPKERVSWDEIAHKLKETPQNLAIVNLRTHALKLYQKTVNVCNDVFHLSTNMCPAHRIDTLNEVKKHLKHNLPCHLISTQCVEAGVDLDFPSLWRAIAPLEAVIQAAGRCNRNGRGEGIVHVFLPEIEEERYPGEDYKKGAVELKLMLEEGDIDICNTDTIRQYYDRYFKFIRMGEKNQNLLDAIECLNFPDVAKLYRWIPPGGINVLVPYGPKIDTFNQLKDLGLRNELSKQWINNARMLSVNIRLRKDSSLGDFLAEVKNKKGERTGYYILLNEALYSTDTGLDVMGTGGDDFYISV